MKTIIYVIIFVFLHVSHARAEAWPPLHRAIASGNADQAEKLIEMGADVNEQEPISGMTPLMIAAWLGQRRHVVKLLLLPRVNPHQIDFTGNNALMYAASKMDLAIFSAILSTQPNLDQQNAGGETSLILAAKYGHRNFVLRLLALGANPELTDTSGRSYSDWLSTP